ncbi:MAG: sigma-70 family RNA polymerase sigma factor [Planctomycetaceae bacterium]
MASPRESRSDASLDVAELVEQHTGLLYGLARRLAGCPADAEDLVQRTFLAAQVHGEQLRDFGKVRGWLCTILRNEFLKMVRKRHRDSMVSLDSLGEAASAATVGEEIDAEAVQQAVDGLPADFRVPVVLYYFQEMSYREIAAELDVPIGTVMSRLSRGKAQLRSRLQALRGGAPTQLVARTG